MRVVILAGGLGTRLAEETEIKPKPMVEIGGRPILWHILKGYAHYGFKEFYIALGYKGELIKRFFLDYANLNGSLTLQLANGQLQRHAAPNDDWTVHLMDTGAETQTGGRLKRLESHLRGGTFMLTYGDGVSNVDLQELLRFHKAQGKIATVTAVRPPARFGGLVLEDGLAVGFTEKPQMGEGWINGGFFVFEPAVFNYLDSDLTNLEADALPHLAAERQLAAYQHEGFWQCMDTLREKRYLENLWQAGKKPWKVWSDEA
jgi:glucose-1-phosphate cytidylyltransferase